MEEHKNAIIQMRFPQKLWYLVSLRTDAILWGGTGRTILLNYRILYNYLQCDDSIFKTTNISSFVRQLNLYGFRKVTSHLQDPLCNSSNPYMHEYIHDFFQYGRPELLNKITRKALTLKRSFKSKNIFSSADQSAFLTPLQKARQALRFALKKTARDLYYIQNSPKRFSNIAHDFEDTQDDFCEEESIYIDWQIPNSQSNDIQKEQDCAEKDDQENDFTFIELQKYGNKAPDNIMSFSDDSCQQNVDSFPGQFLNMPDLDPEPSEETSGVELLAEFNVEERDHGITRKVENETNDQQFLNCVLPSISNDHHNDDVSVEKHSANTNHYHSEWDQMFNDIMTSKGSTQECSSNLKELYTQISQTIHL